MFRSGKERYLLWMCDYQRQPIWRGVTALSTGNDWYLAGVTALKTGNDWYLAGVTALRTGNDWYLAGVTALRTGNDFMVGYRIVNWMKMIVRCFVMQHLKLTKASDKASVSSNMST